MGNDAECQPIEEIVKGKSFSQFLPLMLLLFFGSGCAALIYEVTWLQLLELVIGSSGISLGILLAIYMGGMCLGSLLLPRFISARFHPLRVYALLELGIGCTALLGLHAMPHLADLYAGFYHHGILARSLVAAACLIPPSLLMGATLPAAARFVESTVEGASWLGYFYGGNIAGAVVGCLSAGFFILRLFDMPTAVRSGCVINAIVAISAYLLSLKRSYAPQFSVATGAQRTPSSYRLIYGSIALSGLSAMGAEVIWTRLLSLLLGGTVYAFSIILAVFLVGLGIGSAAGSMLSRAYAKPRLALTACQLLLCATIAWAAFIIAKSLPYWPINPGLYANDWGPWHLFQLDILRAAWMVLPSAFLWGASFPLSIAAVASRNQDSGRMVGGIYAANTVGAIAGALLFSLVVIPLSGSPTAEKLLIITSAASALIAFASFHMRRCEENGTGFFPSVSNSAIIGTTLSGIAIIFFIQTVAQIPWILAAWGRYAASYASQSAPGITPENKIPTTSASPYKSYCAYLGEGMNVSVAVTQNTEGTRFFHGAGKVQASSLPQDMRLQRMLGHASALACKNPDKISDVLVIACGAGVTAGSFMTYPNIKNITICDIEPLVPKVAAQMFGKENYHIVDGIEKQNPRYANGKKITVVYDDGRHYINTLSENIKFDVITSDPIDPWVKGTAALNTIEFYEKCKKHLKPGGTMSLWMPLYESSMASAKSMIGTFFLAFRNGMIFSNDQNFEGYDAVLLGQTEPSIINVDYLQALLAKDEYRKVRESLVEVGFGQESSQNFNGNPDPAINLLATYAARASDLDQWTRRAQINHDRDLRLQYLAGMGFNSAIGTTILQNITACYHFPSDVFIGSSATLNDLKLALASGGRR